jgi:hypothetical protein
MEPPAPDLIFRRFVCYHLEITLDVVPKLGRGKLSQAAARSQISIQTRFSVSFAVFLGAFVLF